MLHLTAFYESVDQGGTDQEIEAVNDGVLFTEGDAVRVDAAVSNLLGAGALTGASTFDSGTVRSPSLRVRNNFPIVPLNDSAQWNSPAEYPLLFDTPISLNATEPVTLSTDSDNGSATAIYGFTLFGSGPVVPARGEIFSAVFTTSHTASAGAWSTGPVTFDQRLPGGRYNVVGLRSWATGLIFSRLLFPGQSFRPGFPAWVNQKSVGDNMTRFGRPGVLGSFDNDSPFSVDIIGGTSTSQTHVVDLIKIA